jgi:nucleotide-binding universal stress UspA family protein
MTFERILFPVDFSDQCRRAAPFVRAIAEHFHANVLVLHVMQAFPPWYGPPEAIPYTALADMDDLRNQRRASLETFLHDELAGVPVVPALAEGDPAQNIVNHAEREKVDLITLPTHGHGPFRSLLLGSVTAKVLHDAECPVWTAAHTEESVAYSPQGWRRILCAVDVTTKDDHTAQTVSWAAELARKESAELRVLHAIEGIDAEADWPAESVRASLIESARQKLANLLAGTGLENQAQIEYGSPASAVRNVATNWGADLVVIGRGVIQKPLGRLRTHAYAVIRESPCPVISV